MSLPVTTANQIIDKTGLIDDYRMPGCCPEAGANIQEAKPFQTSKQVIKFCCHTVI